MSSLLAKGIGKLTLLTNVGTGLAHPNDKSRAQELFKALHRRGIALHYSEIKETALHNGWPSDSADELAKMGEGIGVGRRVVIKHPKDWGEFILDKIEHESSD